MRGGLRARTRTALLLGATVLGTWLVPGGDSVRARPVRVGRYTEIPYGIASDHPYATGGADAQRTGRQRVRAPASAPTMRWEARLRAPRPSAPAITRDGTLYLASSAGITAVQPDGTVAWDARLGYVSGTPSVTPTGELAVGTNAGALVVLGADGRVRSRMLVGGAVRGSPLVLADGSLVVAAFDQAARRFDAEGRQIFRAPLEAQVMGAPAWTGDGTLLVPSGDRLVFLSPRGDLRASVPLGASVASGPAVADDGTIWVLTQDGALHQLAPRGVARTRTELGFPVSFANTMAIGRDGAVRVPTRGDAMVCVGPSGTARWRLEGHGGFLGGVTLDEDDLALAVTERGALLAVGADGTVRWEVETGARVAVEPVLGADGTLYIATVRGTVQAWR